MGFTARRRTFRLTLPLLITLTGCVGPAPERDARARSTDRLGEALRASIPERDTTYLLLRLGERRLHLLAEDPKTPPESFPIAIGRKGFETPTGRFAVEEKVEHPEYLKIDPHDRTRVLKRIPPGPDNPLGERWIAFTHGDTWTIGMHGTPHPELLGRMVSGGCVRMRNADVIRVYDRVKIGTPVIVEP